MRRLRPVFARMVLNGMLGAAFAMACWTLVAPPTGSLAREGQASAPTDRGSRDQLNRSVAKGVGYLIGKGQAPDGSFTRDAGPAVTSLCVMALLRSGRSVDDPAVDRGLKYLATFVREDGGIYAEGSYYQNYETCVTMMCLAEANGDGRYAETIRRADHFVKNVQWDKTEEIEESDFRFGGAGYGTHARPDLSNTSFLIDALRSAGNAETDESIQAALLFVSRSQNLEGPHNATPFAAKNPDGGFYYTPAAGGQSQAGTTDAGGLRSYASMTYAGLKSMIYAGVGPDDPRVRAAVEWTRKNYDLKTNPGIGTAGLYYYYHTFAKALAAMKVDTFEDAKGERHDWRAELIAELARRQRADGSWINENSRWMEGDANLVTAYSLLALSYCRNP